MADKIRKSEDEWRAQLSADEYTVAREAGTERAFTGRYWNTKTQGTYHCVCCGEALFTSGDKYDSGSGWPSFTRAADEARVEERRDDSHGMTRVEIVCARCDAHLGHVFEDGPAPTGMRYCVNSLSLKLEPEDE